MWTHQSLCALWAEREARKEEWTEGKKEGKQGENQLKTPQYFLLYFLKPFPMILVIENSWNLGVWAALVA